MPKIAPLKWAQRDDRVFITFSIFDAKDTTIDFTEDKVVFKCTSGDQAYETTINLLHPIEAEKSTYKVHGNTVACCVFKKGGDDLKSEPWERLTTEPSKMVKHFVGIDWALWKDDDEEAPAMGGFPGMGGFDMSQFGNMAGMEGLGGMGGMGGLGGMGGMGDDDLEGLGEEDEEDAPAAESTEEVQEAPSA